MASKKPTWLDLASMLAYFVVLVAAIVIVMLWMWGVGVSSAARSITVLVMSVLYWFHRRVESRAVSKIVESILAKDLSSPGIFEPGDVASRCAHPGPCDWVRPCSPAEWPREPWFCDDHCRHDRGTDSMGHCNDCDRGIGPQHRRASP
jgi:hypothetical protein